jgi:hypothetical protein
MSEENRVKVCLNCKTYIRIFPDNPYSQAVERQFEINHSCHQLVVIGRDELDTKYEKDKLELTKGMC